MELLLLIIIFAAGWFAGQAYAYWQLRDVVRKYAIEEFGMKIDEGFNILSDPEDTSKKAIKIRALKIEQQKDTLYLFDADTDQFVCQALSTDELAKRVKEINYSMIAGVLHNNNTIWFVDGKVFDSLEKIKL
jgi:hypothetical protein